MQQLQDTHNVAVTWRGKKFILEMDASATLKELGHKLQKLTDVKEDTIRLIVPSNKSPKLLSPFIEEQSSLALQETSIFEVVEKEFLLELNRFDYAFLFQGKTVRMMGVPKDEVDQVMQNAKADLRIAGFDEEEKRLRQRMLDGTHTKLTLPQGTYIFCDFRTLDIPGLELNPSASEALKLMHMLAADPGIVAIMNKHRWRVGIMTEMAPEGYVGISPKCILGFNKNHGEEISLRLRTDDLKGFRKYDSIKKTLLHELAHMIFSEHDANFKAMDKQLNQEAATLDWTRSRSHTLSGAQYSQNHEEEFYVKNSNSTSQKLGGEKSNQLANARASSVVAAYLRLANGSNNLSGASEIHEEPNPDNSGFDNHSKPYKESSEIRIISEPDPDDSEMTEFVPHLINDQKLTTAAEPDPDDFEVPLTGQTTIEPNGSMATMDNPVQPRKALDEPDPDDFEVPLKVGTTVEPNGSMVTMDDPVQPRKTLDEPDPDNPDDSQMNDVLETEPNPDHSRTHQGFSTTQTDEPDPDDEELKRIQDPVTVICNRLQKAIETLQSEVNPSEALTVLQTLFKIIRNVIEHPNEIKFRKLRKANPVIQRNVASYKAAMEILFLIGFNEDVVFNEIGREETYLVLKRNDPGLLWIAKSSLETCIAF
ncbi:hypothetical protein LguiB_002601 [Lonicera macranthoides]